ncbi:uncharacterized protein [Gorilla gorilla gorilla]|uniref:uncharacterized protein n=1 Tax=Gorilla gorilla gorilla TaxID=9595 RepID=UPI0024460804|nr:uncharacterized protein LOC109023718 [Gorilla gorilla gorilla]
MCISHACIHHRYVTYICIYHLYVSHTPACITCMSHTRLHTHVCLTPAYVTCMSHTSAYTCMSHTHLHISLVCLTRLHISHVCLTHACIHIYASHTCIYHVCVSHTCIYRMYGYHTHACIYHMYISHMHLHTHVCLTHACIYHMYVCVTHTPAYIQAHGHLCAHQSLPSPSPSGSAGPVVTASPRQLQWGPGSPYTVRLIRLGLAQVALITRSLCTVAAALGGPSRAFLSQSRLPLPPGPLGVDSVPSFLAAEQVGAAAFLPGRVKWTLCENIDDVANEQLTKLINTNDHAPCASPQQPQERRGHWRINIRDCAS